MFKNRQGFIHTWTLVVSLVGILILIGAGYTSIQQYKEQYKKDETVNAQRVALEQAQADIEKLKEQATNLGKAQKVSGQKAAPDKSPSEITAGDVRSFLSGVVQIDCGSELGSGSLWNLPGIGYGVMTNKHVVKNPSRLPDNSGNMSCIVRVRD